jgi:hypothetical protein
MENGDRITGEIKGLEAGVLTVSLDYVDGNLSVQWSKVAHVKSPQLFIVQMQDGAVYTGALATDPAAGGPVIIRVEESGETKAAIARSQVVRLEETSESFLQALSGDIVLGSVHSKGNNATQYNLESSVGYRREQWGVAASFNSNLSASTGATTSTRNQMNLSGYHLLRRKNYFYSGFGGFLQSSVQGINLQTTLGGGVGRYFKNTNRVRLSVLGGMAWQSAEYKPSVVPIGRQQIYGGVAVTELKVFVFKKTNLTATALVAPAFSDWGRTHIETNAAYYIKLFGAVDWNFSFYGNWDTRPPGNFAGSDYGYSSGLKWTFGYK